MEKKKNIYKMMDGREIDLSSWLKEHIQFIRRAWWWYCNNLPFEEFTVKILGPDSPVLDARKNGPTPTRTPLYDVATDLQFRLGTKQGHFKKDWDGEVDPEWPLNDAT